MSTGKRYFWRALIAGIAVSGTLCALSFVINPDRHEGLIGLLMFAQFPGYLTCAFFLPGSIESISTTNFIAIAVPLNAAVYAAFIFAALRLSKRALKTQP